MPRPEVFVSIDIESDGPAPGLNSMLALGAVAFLQDETELRSWYATLLALPDAQENPETMAWWQTQEGAWVEVNTGQVQPEYALPDFAAWCTDLPGKPVAVAWPAAFDFAFVNYYLHRFCGMNPLGFGALDIRSYANDLARHPGYYGISEASVRGLAGEIDKHGLRPHVAVDDAREQGRLFMALRRAAMRAATGPGREA